MWGNVRNVGGTGGQWLPSQRIQIPHQGLLIQCNQREWEYVQAGGLRMHMKNVWVANKTDGETSVMVTNCHVHAKLHSLFTTQRYLRMKTNAGNVCNGISNVNNSNVSNVIFWWRNRIWYQKCWGERFLIVRWECYLRRREGGHWI